MDPSKLPLVGVISQPEKNVFGKLSNLENKKLLCIGFSEEEIDTLVAPYNPSKIALLTKWADHIDAQVRKYELQIGDITTRTKYIENEFDVILTLSILEHLDDIHGAFDEMARITKPGGDMVHFFGPVWSCAYGHHLYANPHDPNLNFCNWSMPAHIHLLSSQDEIASYYKELGYDNSIVDCVLHWFYGTPMQNRLPYKTYYEIFNQDRFSIDVIERMSNILPTKHLQCLRKKFPEMVDFTTYGAKVKLLNIK